VAKQSAPQSENPAPESLEETNARLTQGKGVPTPKRKEQEAARKRPLVPNDRKEAARLSRAKSAELREKQRIGLAAGDEKFLPTRDRGPQKRYVRDYVDARFNIGEFMIPVMFVVIILTFVPSYEVQSIGILALWAFFLVAVIDCVILGYTLNRKLGAKFGADRVEKVRWYAAMRALQLRIMRLPKAQVKRGQYPA
jgi:hypothetical protein